MEKYLGLYAEPEITSFDTLPDTLAWTNVVVIPACNESPDLLRPPPPCDGRSLMILVINEPVSAPEAVSASNRTLASAVQQKFTLQWQPDADVQQKFGLNLFRDEFAPRDVLLVDRFSEGRQLPVKGGVGHARKIGVDLATSLVHRGRISSPWIHCSDGDVCLPETYFTCSNGLQGHEPEFSTLIYPFFHTESCENQEETEITLATQLYELSLHYYVAGMKSAGSPYAFHTIGSTMAVRASHYAKVRGFPRRAAGEDFYLLNKLTKVGPVLELKSAPDCLPLEIESRRSDRVPFGTGAAVNKITALGDPVSDYLFYDPGVFVLLKGWLHAWPEIWQSGSTDYGAGIVTEHPGTNGLRGGHKQLSAGLKEIGVEKALDHAFRQSRDFDQFTRQMHTWFDAFRTLKLIHFLRDQFLHSVSYAELTARQEFHQLLKQDTELEAFYTKLRRQVDQVKSR